MGDFLKGLPFFRLLIPLVIGILFFYFFQIKFNIIILFIGLFLIFFSFIISPKYKYHFRWMFGLGVYIFIFCIPILVLNIQTNSILSPFSKENSFYKGTIIDVPQKKNKFVSCNVSLSYPSNQKIVCYIENSKRSYLLSPGYEIVFNSKIQPFRNMQNTDEFDYVKYMLVKGFSGFSYIKDNNWIVTKNIVNGLYAFSQRIRSKIVEIYKSSNLEQYEYSLISSLTIGFKDELPEDLKSAFRASGTAHILAVSGLHVGIIYTVLLILFSFFRNYGWQKILKYVFIILLMWMYVFIVGIPASAVRATIMLSILCVGNIVNKKGLSYNTLSVAAFMILLFSPYSLFDIGFQMSFSAVFAMIYFIPKINKLYKPSNYIVKFLWNLSVVSVAAQIGVFPIIMYYFGTFPIYFFIANIIVVPLIAFIVYDSILIAILFYLKDLPILNYIFHFFVFIAKALIAFITNVVFFIESLPYSQISNIKINVIECLLIIFFVLIFARFIIFRRPKHLILSLILIVCFLVVNIFTGKSYTGIVVYNHPPTSDIRTVLNNKETSIQDSNNMFILYNGKRILILSKNIFLKQSSKFKLPIDVLILSRDKNFRLKKISKFIDAKQIVLDSSIPYFTSNIFRKDNLDGVYNIHYVSLWGSYFIKK